MSDIPLEKAPMPVTLLRDRSSALLVSWFEIVQLKQLFRRGWLQRGIDPSRCETVAEHTFGNAMLCLLLLDEFPDLDGEKVLRLALLHDVGEAYVGDITPQDRVDAADKVRRESEAITQILSRLPNGQRLIAEWHEYEQQGSQEARFVKQIDRLELALQASVYEHQGMVDAEEFVAAAAGSLSNDRLQAELSAVRAALAANSGATSEA